MPDPALTTHEAQLFYDRIGRVYQWLDSFEGEVTKRAEGMLALQPGLRVLNLGMGSGKQQIQLDHAIQPGGSVFGLDISFSMLKLARQQTASPVVQADVGVLPYPACSFDRLCAAYLFDLIPLIQLPNVFAECFRLTRPGGRLVLISLTEGINRPSRTLVAIWKFALRISPLACGGCRPVQLTPLVESSGYSLIQREVFVQMALPSEIIAAQKD